MLDHNLVYHDAILMRNHIKQFALAVYADCNNNTRRQERINYIMSYNNCKISPRPLTGGCERSSPLIAYTDDSVVWGLVLNDSGIEKLREDIENWENDKISIDMSCYDVVAFRDTSFKKIEWINPYNNRYDSVFIINKEYRLDK